MVVLELKCPHCGASIEVNEDAAAFDCPKCGSRIVLEDADNADYTRSMPPRESSHISVQAAAKNRSPVRGIVTTVIIIAALIITGLFLHEYYCNSEIKATKEKVQKLIEQGDYIGAETELSAFEYKGVFSKSRKSWTAQKKSLTFSRILGGYLFLPSRE